ncbi:DUF2839 domain-containing protein [Chamaesiphon sp.]|uniref:DUF2839 domain-containing protein n=1 Tax=Chamaesiphon sp. TaxID=2814140 RepID=UPI003592FA73
MGDAKRRKQTGLPEAKRIVSWLPLTTDQSSEFVRVSTRFAWIGIGLLVLGWVTVRLIGPTFGWWQLVG